MSAIQKLRDYTIDSLVAMASDLRSAGDLDQARAIEREIEIRQNGPELRKITPGRGWLLYNTGNGWSKVTAVTIAHEPVDDRVEVEIVTPFKDVHGERREIGDRVMYPVALVQTDAEREAGFRAMDRRQAFKRNASAGGDEGDLPF